MILHNSNSGFVVWTVLLAFSITLLGGSEREWPYTAINLPEPRESAPSSLPVVIAIIDDGIRHTHDELRGYLWHNPEEIPFNGIDDDQNGHVDDVSGWDLADGDQDPAPPRDRASDYYHGTHLSSVIIRLVERVLGSHASRKIQLLPVKTLSDYADRNYLMTGYEGVEYAAKKGADVILCAWSKGSMTPEEARILQIARSKGSLVIAAAGNYSEERQSFPAAHKKVLAVAALNADDQKLDKSTYGTFVDLAAPGINIPGAHSQNDQATSPQSGSSPAAALVAGTAALVKLFNPSFTADQIEIALKSSATPLPQTVPLMQGRLGSGKLNVSEAISANALNSPSPRNTLTQKPQGYLCYNRDDTEPVVWKIDYPGEAVGTYLSIQSLKGNPENGFLTIVRKDDPSQRHQNIKLSALIGDYFIPGPPPVIMWFPEASENHLEWTIHYHVKPVHLPSKYCRNLEIRSEIGSIKDGSGVSPYSPLSDCMWQIKAPPGKWIKFQFLEFETETNTDKLYFFPGSKTNVKPYAIISGASGPPPFTLPYHEALIWFVSDAENEYQGWSIDYAFVDPPSDGSSQ